LDEICNTHKVDEKCVQNLTWKPVREETNSET